MARIPTLATADVVKNNDNLPEMLTFTECLAILKCSAPTLYTLINKGDFPRAVGRFGFRQREVSAWVTARKQGKPLPSFVEANAHGLPRHHQGVLTQWLDASTLMRAPELEQVTRSSYSTIIGWIRMSRFPRPLSPGVWSRAQVEDWVRDREAGKPLPWSNILPPQWCPTAQEKTIRITTPEFTQTTRLERQRVYQLCSKGDFPQPISRGHYLATHVRSWVRDRQAGLPLPTSGKVLTQWWAEHCAAYPEGARAQLMVRTHALRPNTHAEIARTDAQLACMIKHGSYVSPPSPPSPPGLDYAEGRERQAAAASHIQWDSQPRTLGDMSNEVQRELGLPQVYATETVEESRQAVAQASDSTSHDEFGLDEF